jgi:hypothetical protein
MLIAPTPLFPKLALLAASTLGFSVAILVTPEPPAPLPQVRLLATYVYDPGGFTGAIVDFGEGPINLPLREFPDDAYLVSVHDYQAVRRSDGERHVLHFERLQSQDYARRAAPSQPPQPIFERRGESPPGFSWSVAEHPATLCTTKRGSLWTPTPCERVREARP